MKNLLMTLAAGAVMASSAMAAPISLNFIGFSNSAPIVTGNTAPNPTSLTFSNLTIGSGLNCSPTATICQTGGNVSINNGGVFNSAGGQIFTLGNLGLTYTETSAWTETGALGTGLTVFTTGTYHDTTGVFSDVTGQLNFSIQPPSNNNNLGAYNFSASGTTAPEPGSMALLGSGLIGLGLAARRRFKK